MATARTRLAACAAALWLATAPGLASAGIPTGSFEFQLAGANSLWMGGDVDTHEDADGFCASFGAGFDAVEFCDYELSIDGRGKIGGYVEFIGRIGGTRVDIEGPIKGAQRGNNRTGITRASFVIRLAGTATRNGFARATSLNIKLVAQIDAGGVLNGTWSHKVCNEGSPCETTSWPAGPTTWDNGHWTLALDVEDLGAGALGGSARIVFGDDSFCDFTLDGSYDPTKDAANVALPPVTPRCVGGSLRLRPLSVRPGLLPSRSGGLLQYRLFGVSGISYVSTGSTALFHPRASLSLPPSSTGSSGNSAVVTIIELLPPHLQLPAASGSSLSMSSARATITMIQLPPAEILQSPAASVEVIRSNREAKAALVLREWNLLSDLLDARVDP